MKKIALLMITVLFFLMMSSCGSNLSILKNSTKQTAEEIQNTLLLYKTRFLEMIDQPNEIQRSSVVPLSTQVSPNAVRYSRDELPPEYDYQTSSDVISPEFIMTTATILAEYIEMIGRTKEFVEDTFFTISQVDYMIKYKVINEDDQMYIEAYKYGSWAQGNFVYSEIIYMYMVENKINFQQVRETNENDGGSHIERKYYDLFIESGDMLNIVIDLRNQQNIYYQNYQKNDGSTFLVTNSEEGLGFNYLDVATKKSYSIFFDQTNQLAFNSISYGTYHPKLTFTHNQFSFTGGIILKWNLLDIDGWNNIIVNGNDYDEIYVDDTRYLSDFLIEAFVDDYIDANVYVTINEDQLTEGLISLSDYGLSFDAVTYTELMQDRTFLVDHYQEILINQGFSENMTSNYEILYDLFPFFSDPQIVRQLM